MSNRLLFGLGSIKRKFVDWEIKATLDKQQGLNWREKAQNINGNRGGDYANF